MLHLRGRGTGAMIQTHPLYETDRNTSIAANGVVDKYLQKELKLDLYNQQQLSLVEALTKPDTWLGKRETAMKTLTAELSPIYFDAIERYRKLYPVDEAVELANQDIKAIFEVKIKHLELEQPGASLLFQGAMLNNNMDKIKANTLISGSMSQSNVSKDELKKYYKEKRARKKAKRSKKSEGK
jgi:hypothetical protein